MAKQIGYTIQDKITAAAIPQPFDFDYTCGDETIAITVNPVLTMQERKDFCEAIWAMYWGTDNEGNYDFRPYTKDFAQRLFTLYFMTNLKFDIGNEDSNTMRHYNLVMYTDLYEKVIEQLNDRGCYVNYNCLLSEVSEYIDRKCDELADIRALAAKSQIDVLVEELLGKAKVWLDKAAAENSGTDVKDLLSAAEQIKDAANDETLVKNILDYRLGKEGGKKDGRKQLTSEGDEVL